MQTLLPVRPVSSDKHVWSRVVFVLAASRERLFAKQQSELHNNCYRKLPHGRVSGTMWLSSTSLETVRLAGSGAQQMENKGGNMRSLETR